MESAPGNLRKMVVCLRIFKNGRVSRSLKIVPTWSLIKGVSRGPLESVPRSFGDFSGQVYRA